MCCLQSQRLQSESSCIIGLIIIVQPAFLGRHLALFPWTLVVQNNVWKATLVILTTETTGFIFTARCYTERVTVYHMSQYVTVYRLSVRLSVRTSEMSRYRNHTGWNTSKIISVPIA